MYILNIIYNNFVDKFLKHRDERVYLQKSLANKYKRPIVCLRINYPGDMKNNYYSRKINEILIKEIHRKLENEILYQTSFNSLEGPISVFVVNKNCNEIKELCLDIEDSHFLGRLADIDVYDENYNSLSRIDFGNEPRKCYICHDNAFNCSRSKRHSLNEIESYIENKVIEYIKLNLN
jgi:holo-ACP synthase CitX